MAEPLANGIHAWNLSGASATTRIGIIGAGAIGLSVALVAIAHGATDVDVIEPVASRREAAAAIGATTRNKLGSGYDAIFDCAGSSTAHKASLTALANGGTAIWLGLMARDPNFDSTNLVREEKSVRGSYGYTHGEFERAVTLAAMVPDSWVEKRRLVEGPAVFNSLWQGELARPKIALRPDRSRGV